MGNLIQNAGEKAIDVLGSKKKGKKKKFKSL